MAGTVAVELLIIALTLLRSIDEINVEAVTKLVFE